MKIKKKREGRAVLRLCELYPGIWLTTEEKCNDREFFRRMRKRAKNVRQDTADSNASRFKYMPNALELIECVLMCLESRQVN
jgi:hypothetical protein